MKKEKDKLDVYSMSFKLQHSEYELFSKYCFDRKVKMSVVIRKHIQKLIKDMQP